jgi:ATP-binding cassette subfamily B protein
MTTTTPASRGHLVRSVLRDVWGADRRLAISVVALRLAAAVLTPLDAVALGLLIDAGLRGDVVAALWWAALFAMCDVGSSALNHPAGKLALTLRENTNFAFERRLLQLSTAPTTLEHLERPEYHDRIELARDRYSSLGDLTVRAIGLLQAIVMLAVVFAALVSVHWVLVVLIGVALVTIYCGGRAEVVRSTGDERRMAGLRLTDRLFEIATQSATAKEVKVHGVEDVLRQRFIAESDRLLRSLDRTEARAVGLSAAGWLTFAAAFVAALAFVIWQAVHGQATAGQVLLVLALTIRLNEHVEEVTGAFAGIRRAVIAARRLLWLYRASQPASQTAPATAAVTAVRPPAADEDPQHGEGGRAIELRDVSFRYPGTAVDVLRGLSLRLEVGTTVAVVGDNGAGKTTLVKLLSGLYTPTAGAILVDGRDLADLGPTAWQRSLSASFQDFVRFELLVAEAVGVGRVDRMDHRDEVWQAIDHGGARPLVEALPDTLDTQLGKAWPGGVDLSLGQWQKVALSRAMMRRYPALLILDEPSASMDAAAEHALYERFSRATEFGARTSAITLLVSHRFATVRMADIIVLLRDGRASEIGSHDELIAHGGVYAELFELQARGYR